MSRAWSRSQLLSLSARGPWTVNNLYNQMQYPYYKNFSSWGCRKWRVLLTCRLKKKGSEVKGLGLNPRNDTYHLYNVGGVKEKTVCTSWDHLHVKIRLAKSYLPHKVVPRVKWVDGKSKEPGVPFSCSCKKAEDTLHHISFSENPNSDLKFLLTYLTKNKWINKFLLNNLLPT